MVNVSSWNDTLKNGFSSLLDGAIEKELIKTTNEQIPPQGNTQAVESDAAVAGVMNQNIMVLGTPVNKNILIGTGLLLAGIAIFKVVS